MESFPIEGHELLPRTRHFDCSLKNCLNLAFPRFFIKCYFLKDFVNKILLPPVLNLSSSSDTFQLSSTPLLIPC